MVLGDQHQQETVVDFEIYDSTKDHEQQSPGSVVDLEISALMKDSSNLSMNDSFFDNRMETIINAGFKTVALAYGQIMSTLKVFLVIVLWKSPTCPN